MTHKHVIGNGSEASAVLNHSLLPINRPFAAALGDGKNE